MPAMTLFGKYFLWALKDAIEGKFHALKEMIGIHEKNNSSIPLLFTFLTFSF